MRPERAPIYLAPQLRAISRQLATLVPELVKHEDGHSISLPGLDDTVKAVFQLNAAIEAIAAYNATIREYNWRYRQLEK